MSHDINDTFKEHRADRPCAVTVLLDPAAGFQPSVRDFEGLKALARRSGGEAAVNRGACKLCGGLGHLTKQCRNFLDKGGAQAAAGAAAGGADAAAAAAGGGGGDRGLLTEEDEALLLQSDSMDSSDLGSGDDSDRGRVSEAAG